METQSAKFLLNIYPINPIDYLLLRHTSGDVMGRALPFTIVINAIFQRRARVQSVHALTVLYSLPLLNGLGFNISIVLVISSKHYDISVLR